MLVAVDFERIRKCLDEKDFTALFVDVLGWDAPLGSGRRVRIDDAVEALEVATKKGVGVWYCSSVPGSEIQRRLDVEIARLTAERVLVFGDGVEQQWKWPEPRKSGSGTRLVTHRYVAGSRNDGLIQRLAAVRFTLAEQTGLTVIDVRERVRMAFNADTVTAKFYKEFKAQHDGLVGTGDEPALILGIPDLDDLAWYGSVLMNRLMFMYFFQKKGFMDADTDYLRNRLQAVRKLLGRDAFYGFYRDFLLPLFHQGLGSPSHEYSDPEIARIIGDIPYVNGGLFAVHELERRYEIAIPDEAFESIFAFFDRYQWHLDDRPTSEPNEINPDVLGYIFEQYINQKQMGAYYTKEDVTGYMTGSALGGHFLDRLSSIGHDPWQRLATSPERYVPEALRYGMETDIRPQTNANTQPEDFGGLSVLADHDSALPGETWREVIARRDRYNGLIDMIRSGDVRAADTAIELNLDLRTVVVDHILSVGTSAELRQVYGELRQFAVLDPTCGSGAFLFAALDELADFYRAIVQRGIELEEHGDEELDFAVAAREHESQEYYVLKAAMLNNLYGVDIMAEAAEIARLRLFLRLVAQLERKDQVEPLPDLDLNIKTGNLLVGIAHEADAHDRLGKDLLGQAEVASVIASAMRVGEHYSAFVQAQESGQNAFTVLSMKQSLVDELETIRLEVDQRLYDVQKPKLSLTDWRATHQPFHWFIEFPSVMGRGGFDVVVGNPPYIQRKDVTSYQFTGYNTDDCPDVYAPCMERSSTLLRPHGSFAMIVPISFQFSDDFASARAWFEGRFNSIFASTFSRNPAALFSAGLGVRSTIVIGTNTENAPLGGVWTSRLNRWVEECRPHLFALLSYARLPDELRRGPWPRTGSHRMASFLAALVHSGGRLGRKAGHRAGVPLGVKSIALYYVSAFSVWPPAYTMAGKPTPQTGIFKIGFLDEESRDFALAVALSKIGLLWWASNSDDFHVTASGLGSTPIDAEHVRPETRDAVLALSRAIQEEMSKHLIYTKYAGKMMGNYDIKCVRHLTDQVDALLLEDLGLSEYRSDLELFYDSFAKQTGERAGTVRELPAAFFRRGS